MYQASTSNALLSQPPRSSPLASSDNFVSHFHFSSSPDCHLTTFFNFSVVEIQDLQSTQDTRLAVRTPKGRLPALAAQVCRAGGFLPRGILWRSRYRVLLDCRLYTRYYQR